MLEPTVEEPIRGKCGKPTKVCNRVIQTRVVHSAKPALASTGQRKQPRQTVVRARRRAATNR